MMAMQWEIHDGKEQVGPLEEEHVLRMIAEGLPATVLVRPEGKDKWKNVRSHAPFAMAIEAREEAAAPALRVPPPLVPPAPAPAAPRSDLLTNPYVIAGSCLIAVLVLLLIISLRKSAPTDTANTRFTSPDVDQPLSPSLISQAPKPAVVKGSNGGWAVIKRPGKDIDDTPDARVNYMREVLSVAPGEPKLDQEAALALLHKLQLAMAKQSSVAPGTIKPSVGEGSGSLLVSAGVSAKMSVNGQVHTYPVCSEAFLGSGMIDAGIEPADFARVGLRGLLCKSDGCAAIFNMRPTSSGGGMYGGPSCLSLRDMMKLATE